MKILVTGTAGFIGFHLAKELLEAGHEVIGVDCINDYYDVNLKYARLATMGLAKDSISGKGASRSTRFSGYTFYRINIENRTELERVFETHRPNRVCNLAAQAGVRYSLVNPHAYIESNIVGFLNILECCRKFEIEHLAYASSSSVYGLNEKMPLSTSDNVDHPVSLYAASKKSNELMAHCYSHLYGIPTTGLRFFTVYGPWGRPDMALFLFTEAMLKDEPINVFNYGKMVRDFTYIDDIVGGIVRVIMKIPTPDDRWSGLNPNPASSPAPYRVYNIGNGQPVQLNSFIEAIEEELGIRAKRNLMEMQPGDVPATHADVAPLQRDFNYKPNTSVRTGIKAFLEWYKEYYRI